MVVISTYRATRVCIHDGSSLPSPMRIKVSAPSGLCVCVGTQPRSTAKGETESSFSKSELQLDSTRFFFSAAVIFSE